MTDASRAKGMSSRTVLFRMVMGATIAVIPTMRRELKIFDPTTFPTARSAVPFSADTRLTQNSGIDVPIATMVSPMTNCGMRNRSATPTAPSVRRSAPHSTTTTPMRMYRTDSSMYVYLRSSILSPSVGSSASSKLVIPAFSRISYHCNSFLMSLSCTRSRS